jgi:hypothetical protein
MQMHISEEERHRAALGDLLGLGQGTVRGRGAPEVCFCGCVSSYHDM